MSLQEGRTHMSERTFDQNYNQVKRWYLFENVSFIIGVDTNKKKHSKQIINLLNNI